MLYIYAGTPRSGLNAGGLQHMIEGLEEWDGAIEHDPGVQYRREGVFAGEGKFAEQIEEGYDVRISESVVRSGILWDWFPENWAFGNGITVHQTQASLEYRTVIHGTGLTEDEYLQRFGPTRMADLVKARVHQRTEGWEAYEARYVPTTCPMYNHMVMLTWIVTTHRLPEFAYQRIRALIENPATLIDTSLYRTDHISPRYEWHPHAGDTIFGRQ